MALLPNNQTTDAAKKDRAVNVTSTTSPTAQTFMALLYVVPEGKMFTGYFYGTGNIYVNGGGKLLSDSKFYLNEGDTLTVISNIAHSAHITGVESEYSFK